MPMKREKNGDSSAIIIIIIIVITIIRRSKRLARLDGVRVTSGVPQRSASSLLRLITSVNNLECCTAMVISKVVDDKTDGLTTSHQDAGVPKDELIGLKRLIRAH